MVENPFKTEESGKEVLDGETAVVGHYIYRASSFPLHDGSKALVLGDGPYSLAAEVVAALAEETNRAMKPDKRVPKGSHERRIEMSSTYPIVIGDLVLFGVVGFSYKDEDEETQYVDLTKRNPKIQLLGYKIMPSDVSSERMSSRFFLDTSIVTEAGESNGFLTGYLDKEGKPKCKYISEATNLRDIILPYIREEEQDVDNVHCQLRSHVGYSNKKARKEVPESPNSEQQESAESGEGLEIKVTSVPSSPGNNGGVAATAKEPEKTFENVKPEDTAFLRGGLSRELEEQKRKDLEKARTGVYDLLDQFPVESKKEQRSKEATRIEKVAQEQIS